MKILFAAPDRDLLECFKQLLETDLGETVTAFDGTQVISLLMSENFDVLILDRNIPRVDHKTIVECANEKKRPRYRSDGRTRRGTAGGGTFGER